MLRWILLWGFSEAFQKLFIECIQNRWFLNGVFQDVIESQERTITDLLKAVREQNEQLNYQKNKIKTLEDKVGNVQISTKVRNSFGFPRCLKKLCIP